ncbi:ADP-ribosylglycohydrolase family protein [Thermocoleostomius sinensis]|uniref:ADP-ribosylglycohydrolase family protein n=1 Tax=Thermocoleostomius sinensis A174 TaxID=2016057 RepID=A0A9E8ZI42_9CYAN|nr:ADP-ribosylglycohydrolase family protein [Thermocoleostomius sinensis]WAL61635.1 ADP-ribosylglycohydrolase family protein [Thermocoleostomius sinensis A174]
MQHSLRHRFRGALLGAALGETLGITGADRMVTQTPRSWFTVHTWGFQVPPSAAVWWGKLAAMQLRKLLPTGPSLSALPNGAIISEISQGSSVDRAKISGFAIASLPIALFYHEDWQQLQHHLEQTLSDWQLSVQDSPVGTALLAVHYGVALALRERLHPAHLLARLTVDLDLQDRAPLFLQQLNQVQRWLSEGTELSTIQSMLKDGCLDGSRDTTPIALALYGFLGTPTNFRVSLLRMAQLPCQPQITCAITGALSGAYNSLSGLPWHWRTGTRSITPSPVCTWGATSEADLLNQADLLWAAWSGAYNPTTWLSQPTCVTASPHVIRPR